MLLKDTELVSSPVKILNYKFGFPQSEVSDVSCRQDCLCQCFPYEKKGERKRGYCFTICRSTIYLVFPGNILFFPPGFFFFLSRNALYQKVWTNGHSRCLGCLGAHLFICVGPVGLCVVSGPQILHTLGRNVLLTENRESPLHNADRTPVLLTFSLCVAHG